MNPVLLASASALAEATPEKGAISAPATPANGSAFSLPQTDVKAVAERLLGAKVNQQHASAAERQHDDANPAAMQALLAMLLAQPAQAAAPAASQQQPDGEMLKMLTQMQSANTGGALLRQLVTAMEKQGSQSTPASHNAPDLSALPPKLQGLLSALTQDMPQATPEQQAKLTTFSAQDLRVISPAQQPVSPSQQISARASAAETPLPRPVAMVKKSDGRNLNPSVSAQSLLNLSTQGNQPANALADRNVAATQTSAPVAMSPDELGEKLTALLKDRIQFQLGQQQQISTIRLDPPSLGKLKIAVQLDAGKLMVHIGANQSDVCRSLQQFSENLRQHLTAQNFMEVNVQVSSEGQSQQQQQQQSGHQKDEVMSALMLSDEPQYQQNESVLIKV